MLYKTGSCEYRYIFDQCSGTDVLTEYCLAIELMLTKLILNIDVLI